MAYLFGYSTLKNYQVDNTINHIFMKLTSCDKKLKDEASKKIAEYLDKIWTSRKKNYYVKFMSQIDKLHLDEIERQICNAHDTYELCLLYLKKNLIMGKFGLTIHRLTDTDEQEYFQDNIEHYDTGDVVYNEKTIIYDGVRADLKHRYIEFSSLEELKEFYLERRKYWEKRFYKNNYLVKKEYSYYYFVEYFPLNIEYFKEKKDALINKDKNLLEIAHYKNYADKDKHKKSWIEKIMCG